MKKKVVLITSTDERCGIQSYGTNLMNHCPWFTFEVISNACGAEEIINRCSGCDLAVLNYEPGLFGHVRPEHIRRIPIPKVLILHTSHEGDNRSEFTSTFTRVVVHEQTTEGFTFIPHGIPTYKGKGDIQFDIGTVGFPFSWKGFTQVVEAAKILDKTCLVITPESRHADAEGMKVHLQSLYDKVTVVTNWMSEKHTIDMLSGCRVNVFAYHGGNYGISGACRMGLATGNPLILSTSRQFRDLFKYDNEIEFIPQPPTGEGIVNAIRNLYGNKVEGHLDNYNVVKWPIRVLEDMNWNKTGMQYKKLFEEVMG